MSEYQPTGALLVGSVPLSSAEEVFRSVSQVLGDRLMRLPDGETGPRLDFIGWQSEKFRNNPQFETVPPPADSYNPLPRAKLKAGIEPDQVDFGSLGYADDALASWEIFERLQREGTIPGHMRFQVCMPSPMDPVQAWIANEDQQRLLPQYEKAMLGEVDRICAKVPADHLAIQWDAPIELMALERIPVETAKAPILDRLARIGSHVPEGVELGYHWCYGDFGHKHAMEPPTLAKSVEATNAMTDRVTRKIDFFHMPVPRNRADDEYFAALSGIRLNGATLYLGLIHLTDGVEGTRKRIDTAKRHIQEFGAATECGFGRRDPATIADLLKEHAAVVAPVV